MYVYIYIYMYVHMHIYIYTHIHIYISQQTGDLRPKASVRPHLPAKTIPAGIV